MKLTFKDRVSISVLYPKSGSLVDQVMVKDISSKTDITQEEIKEVGMKSFMENGVPKTRWDNEKAKDKEVNFTEAELEFLRNQVEAKDKKKEITRDIIDLCLKLKDKS